MENLENLPTKSSICFRFFQFSQFYAVGQFVFSQTFVVARVTLF